MSQGDSRPGMAREQRRARDEERRRERERRTAAGRDRAPLRSWRRLRRWLGGIALRALGPVCVRLLSATWRVERRGAAGLATLKGKTAWILMLWHGRLLVGLPLRHHAHRGLGVLVSPSDDGALAEVALRRFGYRILRGSSHRGGTSALRAMRQLVAEGVPIVITPDGPRGPRHAVNTGPFWLARETGAPLLTFGVSVDRAWRLRSWDDFTIPKPFARIVLTYGDPIRVDPACDDETLEKLGRKTGDALLRAEREGFCDLGATCDHPPPPPADRR